ncbi:glycosyltransferase family 1 protein [Roridomyces roridus]|uniref:UDP-N-acetylglucosamine transferase subunit ALG14 n=1 Tax=Roridomyces roridus TaxID=1738132 RepID=A0AAD7CFJ2_9AGAR|nr:glycosyltransferase family 1 protein [Roridomyces roridus]
MHLPIVFTVLIVLYRLYCALPRRRNAVQHSNTKSLAVFLGSGGHTSEALTLLSALDFERYCPRTYVISEGDSLSAQRARDLESSKASSTKYTILTIPRARRVHQSLATTPPTALHSLLSCIYHVTLARKPFADILILNGPGTCFVLCIAVCVNRFLGLSAPKTIYIESFARVESLSLSGKLLYPFVDRFVVQWRQLLKKAKGAEFRGLLV